MRDAALDLLTGSHCAGCGLPGRPVCATCRAGLAGGSGPVSPDPRPPGLVPVWATGPYDGVLRSVVLTHKERCVWSLSRVLGDLLADSVTAAASGLPAGAEVVLVPVPSRAVVVRRRAYDPTRAMVSACADRLRRRGARVGVAPVLSVRGGVRDQAGLDSAGRRENLARAMWCPSPGLIRLARRPGPRWLVVCDDVVTSGHTLCEASRALADVGIAPFAAACVAATQRRPGPGGGGPTGDQGP
ncbi:MAG: ComF family protein [Nocardioides sp.]|uniref:ComF family protein n=1 Tax=Nocardioides sp. TaxID=35761 RepID=UPI003F0CD15A